MLDSFVKQYFTPNRENTLGSSEPPARLEAIVLAGQMTSDAVECLGDIVESSIPGSRRLFRTTHPEFRAAAGAVCMFVCCEGSRFGLCGVGSAV